jgi:hypothetical protein
VNADDRTLEVAELVARELHELGIETALIGAVALAVHRYVRSTEDIDLGISTRDLSALRAASDRIKEKLGLDVQLVLPDDEDPLGGVLTITGEGFDPVQVVNLTNPLAFRTTPGAAAIGSSIRVEGLSLPTVDLPHLVALKLYAGDPESQADVLAVLKRNPDCSLDEIRAVCERFGLAPTFDSLLQALHA